MGFKIDLTVKRFGRLTVLEECGRDKFGQIMWKCKCDCSNTCYVRGSNLRRGQTKSCGCLNEETRIQHIKAQTVDHSNPASIKSSKLSVKNTSGVRGVCPTKRGRWRAYIGHRGQYIFLGEYSDIQDAIKARKKAEEKYHLPILEKE